MYDQLSVFDAAGYITHTGEQRFGRIGLYRKRDPDISRLFIVVQNGNHSLAIQNPGEAVLAVRKGQLFVFPTGKLRVCSMDLAKLPDQMGQRIGQYSLRIVGELQTGT